MDFKQFYEEIKKKPTELRLTICERLSISQETFYVKYRENSFSYPQKLAISELLGISVSELFPD